MQRGNISFITEWNLCCGCGVCTGICPQNCITTEKKHGMYLPRIDLNRCVKCNVCLQVCPGHTHIYPEGEGTDVIKGRVLAAYNAWSRNPSLRHTSASGGVITTIVKILMDQGKYDTVFLLDTYDYHDQLKTKPFHKGFLKEVENTNFPKSRYLPVSHENAVIYIKEHRNERIILIGSSCALRGLHNIIRHLGMPEENYLFLGLFCDRVFNYNVLEYYQDQSAPNQYITSFHFKNKESGGWPGNMKFYFKDGTFEYRDKTERTKLKDYFMPERCLYCIDKLNVTADISTGDNYTDQNSTELGSNSVIIRTEKGMEIWGKVLPFLDAEKVDIEKILKAQYIEGRFNNYYYGCLKEKEIFKETGFSTVLNEGVQNNQDLYPYKDFYKDYLEMLRAGELYSDNPSELQRQIEKAEKRKNKRRSFVKRAIGFVKRKIF